jgi:hypothetical protein
MAIILSEVEKARKKYGTKAQDLSGRGSVSHRQAWGGDGAKGTQKKSKSGKGSIDYNNKTYGNVGNGSNAGYYPVRPSRGGPARYPK